MEQELDYARMEQKLASAYFKLRDEENIRMQPDYCEINGLDMVIMLKVGH